MAWFLILLGMLFFGLIVVFLGQLYIAKRVERRAKRLVAELVISLVISGIIYSIIHKVRNP